MPTTNQGRPFFTNFFAAFRAQAAVQKSSATPASVVIASGLPHTPSNTSDSPPAARTISTKASTPPPAITGSPHQATTFSPPTGHPATFRASRPVQPAFPAPGTAPARGRGDSTTRTYSTSPTTLPTAGTALPLPLALPSSTCSSGGPSSPPSGYSPVPFGRSRTPSLTRQKQRRGSDTSSDGGFVGSVGAKGRELAAWDLGAAEKWYIGGKTAQGEERFYKLGLVKRYGSEDRLSLDRLSL